MVKHVARAALRVVVLFVVVGLVGGCAGYKIQENGGGCGYDVYAPEPYLQATLKVAKDEANRPIEIYEFTLVWLPNYGKRYRVHSWAGFGSADFEFAFKDGWQLQGIKDKSDNTEVLKSLVALAQHLLPAAGGGTKSLGGTDGATGDMRGRPILYRIDFDAHGRPACLVRLDVRCLDCPSCVLQKTHPCPTTAERPAAEPNSK